MAASNGSPLPVLKDTSRTGLRLPSCPKTATDESSLTLCTRIDPSASPTATVSSAGAFARHVTATPPEPAPAKAANS